MDFGRRNLVLAALALLVLLAALFAWLLLGQKADKADIRAALQEATEALHWPGRDIEAAAQTLENPEAALAFLQSHIQETSYAGAIYEPAEVLALRTGNRIDRARLLHALIETMGEEARLVSDGNMSLSTRLPPVALPDAYQRLVDALGLDRDAVPGAYATEIKDIRTRLEGRLAEAEARLEEVFELPNVEPVSKIEVPNVWVEVAGEGGGRSVFDLEAEPSSSEGEAFDVDPAQMSLRVVGTGRDGRRHALMEYDGPVRASLNLSFQPNVGPADAFGKPPAPETVAAWAPVLSFGETVVSGRVFTPAGELPPDDGGQAPLKPQSDPAAPAIEDLTLLGLDVSAWPEVRARLSGRLPRDVSWQAAYLKISDEAEPQYLRLRELPLDSAEARPVILLIDASASMAAGRRAFHARDLAHAVLEELPDDIPIEIVRLAGSTPTITYPMAPLSDREQVAEAIDATFILDNALPLTEAVDSVTRADGGPMNILLLGDGAVSDPDGVARLLDARDLQMYAVAIDADSSTYAEMGGAWRWNSDTAPKAIAKTLVAALDDKLEVAWTVTGGSPGDQRTVTIEPSGGGSAALQSAYVVPEAAASVSDDRIAALTLELTLSGVFGPVEVRRHLLALGPDASPWGLEMQGRIGIAPGPSPDHALIGAYLDEWLALFDAELAAAEDRALALPSTGPGLATLQRIDGLFALGSLANGEPLTADAPLVFFERLDPQVEEEGNLVLKRTLDVLYDGGLTDRSDTPWRIGLALAEAEAALLETDGVNQRLLGAEDSEVVGGSDRVPTWLDAAFSNSVEDGTQFYASRAAGSAWVLTRDGKLEARLLAPFAKGASAEEIAGEFRALRSRLELMGIFSGAAGSMAGLSGIPHGGIIGILDQNLRLWCFSSVMMGYVGDEIAGLPTPGDGDPAAWEASAQSLCELGDPANLARAYAAAMASGMVSGYAGDVLSQRKLFGPSPAGDYANNVFWNSAVSASEMGPALYDALRAEE